MLKWPEALHLALRYIRNAPRQPSGLSPAEVLFGKHSAIPGTSTSAQTSLLNGDEHTMFQNTLCFKIKRRHAQWYQPTPPEMQVHNFQPGHKILIKVFSRKSKLEPRWQEPCTLLLSSYVAVKVTGKGAWIHRSHKWLPEDHLVDERQLSMGESITITTLRLK